MARTLDDMPQNAAERQVFDQAYARDDGWIRLGAFFLPAIPLAPLWWPIVNLIGFEGAAIITFLAQMACVAVIPDRVMLHRAYRALAAYRASQPVEVELGGPTASFRPENYR